MVQAQGYSNPPQGYPPNMQLQGNTGSVQVQNYPMSTPTQVNHTNNKEETSLPATARKQDAALPNTGSVVITGLPDPRQGLQTGILR